MAPKIKGMASKVAKALANRNGPKAMYWTSMPNGYWEGQARAAIEAMREPTPEMIDAVALRNGVGLNTFTKVWQTAIDEILK